MPRDDVASEALTSSRRAAGKEPVERRGTGPAPASRTPGLLDAVVFVAYRWPADLSGTEILERLLALNLERAAAETSA